MKDAINFDLAGADKPKYQLMVERLEDAIGAGAWKPGDKLPSNRELASRFGVTIGTVSKAMSEAVRRGVVDTRVGSGTYIREPNRALAAQGLAKDQGPAKFDLSLNVLPLGPVQDFLQQALDAHAAQGGRVHGFAYTEVQHSAQFRRTGARWLSDSGTPAEADRVIVTGGVHHGLLAAFQVLLQPADIALCDVLSYTGFQRIARLRGVQLVGVAGDSQGMNPDELEAAIRSSGAKVLIVNPVLQNPLATTMSAQRRAQIAELCRRHDLRVIEDGVNVALADPGEASVTALIPERSVHLTGFSKSVATGFRLGYATMPEEWLVSFQEAILGVQWFVPSFYAELLEVMRSEGLLDRCVQAQRTEAAARQQMLRQALPQAVFDGAGYHAWIPATAQWRSVAVCEQASLQNVNLSAAHHFAVNPESAHPDGLRISLGGCRDSVELRRCLDIVVALITETAFQRRSNAAPAA